MTKQENDSKEATVLKPNSLLTEVIFCTQDTGNPDSVPSSSSKKIQTVIPHLPRE